METNKNSITPPGGVLRCLRIGTVARSVDIGQGSLHLLQSVRLTSPLPARTLELATQLVVHFIASGQGRLLGGAGSGLQGEVNRERSLMRGTGSQLLLQLLVFLLELTHAPGMRTEALVMRFQELPHNTQGVRCGVHLWQQGRRRVNHPCCVLLSIGYTWN